MASILKLKRWLLVAPVIAASLFVPLLVNTRIASALTPGCYALSQGEYLPANCTDNSQAVGVEQGFCYVAAAGNGIGEFVQYDCNTLTSTGGGGNNSPETNINEDGQKIYDRLRDAINFLSAIAGIIVVGSIVWGAIQYTTAGSDPQKVSAAKNRIFNAVIALMAYIFIFSFLQWLVPGGIF